MSLAIGTRFGPYEVTAQLGAGGMGEVYRARDTKLHRDVAIKVLLPAVANDRDRLARFSREAQVLASLNHTNIAHIHGFEDAGGTPALVMELVEGPTLADHVAQGALPIDDALTIARQIAEALEAAHEQGIIHRDLKPTNIKVRKDGVVKVLDFGLAKAIEKPGDMRSTQASTLMGNAATRTGVILGTVPYMSPEQARGLPVDKRTDVWAFGCVLYEMLTSRGAFVRSTPQETLAAVLEREPDWPALPAHVPPAVGRLLRRCLDKDPKRRLRDIGDARVEIEDALSGRPDSEIVAASRVPRDGRNWVALAAVIVAAVIAIGVLQWRAQPAQLLPETRLDIATPPTDNPGSFALSPDGRRLAFVARDGGISKLWLRSLSEASATAVPGTEGATYSPLWSPDGRALVFFAGNFAKRLDLESGAVSELVTGARYGAWGSGGTILFGFPLGPLRRLSPDGGETIVASTLLEGQTQHWHPTFLPDGRRFLYYASPGPNHPGTAIYVGDLSSATMSSRVLGDIKGGSPAAYLATGWLLFMRGTALLAQRFDAAAARLSGEPVRVADQMGDTSLGPALSVSTTGVIAYRSNTNVVISQLTWVDRTGRAQGVFGKPGLISSPELSPDDARVLTGRSLRDDTRVEDRTALPSLRSVWSPDGRRFIVGSITEGRIQLFVGSVAEGVSDGAAPFLATDQNKVPTDWSPDGRFFLFTSLDPRDGMDMWLGSVDGDPAPIPWLKTRFMELGGQFSPDGKFVAYQSDQSGRSEIYIRPFLGARPSTGRQWPVSSEGGVAPRWRADGRELYYLSPDAMMMAAPVAIEGDHVRVGQPVPLFKTAVKGGGTSPNEHQFDVSRDGRFLINVASSDVAPITIIQNWKPPVR